jgi:hypothetical protein
MVIETLFTIAKLRNQSRYLSTDEWINKYTHTHAHAHTHTCTRTHTHTQWSVIQPLRRMKTCCLQENGWTLSLSC